MWAATPSVKNRAVAAKSAEPTTTWPSLRGRTGDSRRSPGALGLLEARADRHGGPEPDDRFLSGDRRRVAPDVDVEPAQLGADAVEVVGVVRVNADLDQSAHRRGHEAQLLPAVDGGERAVAQGSQAKLGVVVGDLGDVRHADGDRKEPMEGHGNVSHFRQTGERAS